MEMLLSPSRIAIGFVNRKFCSKLGPDIFRQENFPASRHHPEHVSELKTYFSHLERRVIDQTLTELPELPTLQISFPTLDVFCKKLKTTLNTRLNKMKTYWKDT